MEALRNRAFPPAAGAVRRLGAAAWRLDGKADELDLTLRARQGRFPHGLLEDR